MVDIPASLDIAELAAVPGLAVAGVAGVAVAGAAMRSVLLLVGMEEEDLPPEDNC